MSPNIIDPFHGALYKVLTEKLQDRVTGLANGSARAILGSNSTVAENYAVQTSYILALQDIIGMCVEVEQEMYGKRQDPENQQE